MFHSLDFAPSSFLNAKLCGVALQCLYESQRLRRAAYVADALQQPPSRENRRTHSHPTPYVLWQRLPMPDLKLSKAIPFAG